MGEPAEHAAVVRGALNHGKGEGGHNNYPAAEASLAALVALAERAAELERERDRCAHDYGQECELRDEAEARAERAEVALREAENYCARPPGTCFPRREARDE